MNLTGKLLLATATVAALSSGALAADLSMPMKPAPIMAPAASTSWDGPYVGAKIGYGWGTLDAGAPIGSASTTGFLAGAQIGYNFHLSDAIVAGVEGDLDWSNETATLGAAPNNGYRTNWDGAVLGRLGVDLNGILPYAEAGVAFANGTWGGNTATHTGWTAGLGVQFQLADQLSADVQYRYSDYGSQTYGGTSAHLTDNVVSVGLNYHF